MNALTVETLADIGSDDGVSDDTKAGRGSEDTAR